MKAPGYPANEAERLKALSSYEILDTERENDFNALMELAAHVCGCPIAAISFVDKERQWFKAEKNLFATETTRDISFCGHTILQDDVMIIPDARKDERFAGNPLVTRAENKIIFYAGAPITNPDGYNLGSICVIDNNPRPAITDQQKEALKGLAQQVMRLMELRLKNKLIKDQGEKLLKAEKTITRLSFSEQEKEKRDIARELHENFAQILAATNMYLEMAGSTPEMSRQFLEKSKENIRSIITGIRNLCQTIVPTTLPDEDYAEILQQYIRDWQLKHPVQLTFIHNDHQGEIEPDAGLIIFRVIQKLLSLTEISQATSAILKLKKGDEWLLQLEHDGNPVDKNCNEGNSLINRLMARTSSIYGTFIVLSNKPGSVRYDISIPCCTKKMTESPQPALVY